LKKILKENVFHSVLSWLFRSNDITGQKVIDFILKAEGIPQEFKEKLLVMIKKKFSEIKDHKAQNIRLLVVGMFHLLQDDLTQLEEIIIKFP